MKFIKVFLIVFIIVPVFIQSQKVIQFSGVVVTGDSLKPVPFVNIAVEKTNRGTISDYFGFFSLVAQEKDTINFASIGFRDSKFIIPENLPENKYSLIQILTQDTIELDETVVYPWPSPEQFKEAFLALEIPESDVQKGAKNLSSSQMIALAENMGADGGENFKYQMNQDVARMYYAGQAPSLTVLNPLAWAEFIEAWRNGLFKKKKE